MEQKQLFLGIELGSTRIKAVLIDHNHKVVASGNHDWENKLEGGYWTYSLDDALAGVASAFGKVAFAYKEKFGEPLATVGAMGVSAMMHGYLPFDENDVQLADFRSWRNTTTEQAAELLTKELQFNIPQRWSAAHLYQAVLNQEPHINNIAFITTLSGYIHYLLTGERVLGVGDASGMFPIDSITCDYDKKMAARFNQLLSEQGCGLKVEQIFPKVATAGTFCGNLTKSGAALLDPTGVFCAGVPLCPPEGDAGTGMVATNSVAKCTGNISAGTSIFAMLVLERPLSKPYLEVDMVSTPSGSPVAMVHCNTCTSDMDAWINLLAEAIAYSGSNITKAQLYDLFYEKALSAQPDCGGLINFNYYSGEPITGTEQGRPLFVRRPAATLNFANFARAQIYSTMATLKIGMEMLFNNEDVTFTKLLGHGGLFKTPVVGARIMASALNVPIAVTETAAEGGAFGIAVLAAFAANKGVSTLCEYLEKVVFNNAQLSIEQPNPEDVDGFNKYIIDYKNVIAVQKAAAIALK